MPSERSRGQPIGMHRAYAYELGERVKATRKRDVRISVMVTQEQARDIAELALHWRTTVSSLLWGIIGDWLWKARGRRGSELAWTSESALQEAIARLRGLWWAADGMHHGHCAECGAELRATPRDGQHASGERDEAGA